MRDEGRGAIPGPFHVLPFGPALWRGGDPAFAEMVDRQTRDRPELTAWRETLEIWEAAAGEQTLNRPGKGALRLDDDPAPRLVIYTPGESPQSADGGRTPR